MVERCKQGLHDHILVMTLDQISLYDCLLSVIVLPASHRSQPWLSLLGIYSAYLSTYFSKVFNTTFTTVVTVNLRVYFFSTLVNVRLTLLYLFVNVRLTFSYYFQCLFSVLPLDKVRFISCKNILISGGWVIDNSPCCSLPSLLPSMIYYL